MIVCISGSMRFEDEMRDVAIDESLKGSIVVMPNVNMKRPDPRWEGVSDEVKNDLDRLHLRKIAMSDRVVVVCPGGYIGDSTRRAIEFAERVGVPVEYLGETP